MPEQHPIPATLNLMLTGIVLCLLLAMLSAVSVMDRWWQTAALALGYGLLMNTGYALLHEAEHNLLHPNHALNQTLGVILGLFFPAPFHLLRQGHIGHHMRNRSDDEAFDFYFEGESPLWKRLQLYGILTGLFWIVIVLSNAVAVFSPRALINNKVTSDRPTAALQESLNPKYLPMIRLEAFGVFVLHGGMVWLTRPSLLAYATVLFGFGCLWSALQYVHHFGTNRDVRSGARNLKTFSLIDLLWLNHNWHLNHHLSPTVSWVYLPFLYQGEQFARGSLFRAYLAMWRGPRFTSERIENRYAGKIIN